MNLAKEQIWYEPYFKTLIIRLIYIINKNIRFNLLVPLSNVVEWLSLLLSVNWKSFFQYSTSECVRFCSILVRDSSLHIPYTWSDDLYNFKMSISKILTLLATNFKIMYIFTPVVYSTGRWYGFVMWLFGILVRYGSSLSSYLCIYTFSQSNTSTSSTKVS